MDQIENVKSVYGLWPCCPLLLLPVYGLHRLLVVQQQQQQQEEAQQEEPSCRLSRSRRLARRGFDSAARLSYDTISSAKATLWRFPPPLRYLLPLPCPVELSRSDACNMLLQLVVAAANLGLHLLRFLPSLDVVPPSTVSR